MTGAMTHAALRASIKRHLAGGLAAIALLCGGVGGWAATAEIAGAVIAPGSLVVESNVKKVQHPTGGIVDQLEVREGQSVKAGDVLMRLDGTQVRAQLQIITNSLDELFTRRARLEAEREGAETIGSPTEVRSGSAGDEVSRLLAGEQKLFASRREWRDGQKKQLRERIVQFRQQAEGLLAQSAAKESELEAVAKELETVRDLYARKLTTLPRLSELEQRAARLQGDIGQLTSEIAQVNGKVAEIELQILQIDQELRSDVGGQLSEVGARISELIERKVAAEDQLSRLEIRAPLDGTVHQLAIHTVGGVIEAGESLMLVVPESDELAVEARVAPQEIDRVHIGQSVSVRFSTFNQRTTPEIHGKLARISPNVEQDQRTGTSHYMVQIDIPPDQIGRLGEIKLIPGMPVETFVSTEKRTVLSYLAKPLSDQFTRAFRQR